MSSEVLGICWNCGAELEKADYGRENTCRRCGKSTRACRNCRFFAPGRPNDCVEPMVERVLDKEKANYCELFAPSDAPVGRSAGATTGQDDLLKAAEKLFSK